jgi:hypothetical protein
VVFNATFNNISVLFISRYSRNIAKIDVKHQLISFMCLVLTLCFTSMTRTFCSPVAGCEVSSLFLYDFNVTLRNNNHMYVWIYFSCFNPFCFNGDTFLFPLFHLFNSLLNKTDRHDITEILLKVALKTTDCHDITEILLKNNVKYTFYNTVENREKETRPG